ncbi:hypothetical protein EUX98_g8546 [Antrodiella citrinella]|uniref:Methyltransferase domain-containing protein n=1 Tax=Antrodiella citrinella TaxID=2447956 RepID=A0A4S4M851_9APHY|nr:hypothetical protein EUX98_g8546 [Antrodiella citrinella]
MGLVVPAVLLRHPRYTVLVAVTFVIATLVLTAPSAPSVLLGSNVGLGSTSSLNSESWVEDAVREEEVRYGVMLKDRAAMVRKYGPTPESVQAYAYSTQFPEGLLYTLWDFYIPSFQCPHRVERLGTMGDGGKWVCGFERVAKQPECVIYSFGINEESSFEAALLTRSPGCQVWGYDFSVSRFGPEIESLPALKSRSHFHPYALSARDAHAPEASPPEYTLASLMAANNHTWIDVLKVDIEGAEFESLAQFVDDFSGGNGVLPVGQMQLEIHAREWSGYGDFAHFNVWWEKLERAGMRPFWTEANLVYLNIFKSGLMRVYWLQYSFLNVRGEHALVSDKYN